MNILFRYSTKLGETYPFVIALLGLLAYKKWRSSLALVFLLLGATLLSGGLKLYFKHDRPSIYLPTIGKNVTELGHISGMNFLEGDNSFPSGHTLFAFALYTTFAYFFRRHNAAFLWFIPAFLVGFSRIYLCHHFLEDVVFGAALGLTWGLLLCYGGVKYWEKD